MAALTHLRIVGNFALKFVLLALPAVGILLSHSSAWNVVWWLAYLGLGIVLARYEQLSNTMVGTMWAQSPIIILLETEVSNQVLWALAGLWAALAYGYIYREALLLNRSVAALIGRNV